MENAELKDTPIVKTVGPHIDRYIWPGAMPSTLETNMKIAGEDILYNGKSMDKALATANDIINVDLANANFTASENPTNIMKNRRDGDVLEEKTSAK